MTRITLMATVAMGALTLAGPQMACAQGAGDAAAVEAVVVTGSRLNAAGFQAPTPVTVLGAANMQAHAATSVYDMTKDIPVFRNTSGPQTTTGQGLRTSGQALLDLRGLGASRTLVLVEGMRPTPVNGSLTFDTNMIPASLVDRTEVVTGGASAAYGSDAIAGVVNFILKKRLQGMSGTLQTGRSIYGDNKEDLISLAYGKAFLNDKAHFIIGGDYNVNKGVTSMYDREWGRREPGIFTLPASRAAGLPANIYSDYNEMNNNTAGGVINSGPLKGTAFDLNGNPYVLQQGLINGTTEMISPNQTNYMNNKFSNTMIRGPYERYAILTRLEYEFTPDLTAYAAVNYGELQTHTAVIGFSPTTIIIANTNPYIPAATRAAMAALNLTSFTVSKLSSPASEMPGWTSGNHLKNFNASAGVNGKVFGDWSWDAGYQIGHTDWPNKFLNTAKTANYWASTYVVAGPNGTPVCGPLTSNPNYLAQTPAMKAIWLANLEPGCVPYNLFGTKNASPEWLRYIMAESIEDADLDQQSAHVNLAGEPFMLPAGPLSLAVGAEWRATTYAGHAAQDSKPFYLVNENNVAYTATITVKEGYGEIGVPLLKDLPLIKNLDLNGAVRRTEYSTSGGVTTWKVGAVWEVNDMVRLRVTRSRDIRAPNFQEVFLKGLSGAGQLTNKVTGASGQISGGTTGNPNLQPEQADTLTAGIVFQPTWDWAWGLRTSVDWYSIDIADVIATIPTQDIVDRCFVNKLQQFCSFLTLDNSAVGFNYSVNYPLNLNALKTNGIDFEVSMRPPIDAVGLPGRLEMRTLGTWVDDLRTITPTVTGVPSDIDAAGQSVSSLQLNTSFTYTLPRFSANLTVRYLSDRKYSTSLVGPNDPTYNPAAANSINRNLFPSSTLWYLNGSYDLVEPAGGRRLQIFGVIENLFDKDPPGVVLTQAGGSPYDMIGRNLKVGLRFEF